MRPLLASLFVLFALALSAAALAADTPSPTAVAACQSEYAQIGADAFKAKYGATEPFGHCYQEHAPAVTTTTTTSTTTTTTSEDDPATAACKAEYLKLGPDAFKAKYGATEAFGNCLKLFTAPKTEPKPAEPDSPAVAACKAEYLRLGGDAFKAKYGASDPLEVCAKAQGDSHTTTSTSDKPDKPKPSTPNGDDGAASVASAFCGAEAKTLGKAVFLVKYGPKEAMGNCVKAALAKAKSLVASCKAGSGSNKDAFKACVAAGVQPRRR